MIAERLDPQKVVFGLRGDFTRAIDRLCSYSPLQDFAAKLHAQKPNEKAERYSLIGDGIAVPHVRIDNLPEPELILGLAPEGLKLNSQTIHIVLVLATPAEQPAQHLQLLQRICSLLPAIRDEILRQRDSRRILQIIARAEQLSALPSYLNLTQEQIGFELETDLAAGLASTEARSRLAHYGRNVLRRVRREPWYIKLLRNLFSFFAVLLWIAAILCFIPGVDLPQLGSAILMVILINGLFAFMQEYKSDRALEMLQQLIAQKCRVLRDGQLSEIAAAELVPGDLITLEAGDLVPADARLLEAFEVEVDNSSLTGESSPARRYKSDQPVLISGKFLWIELPNVVFAGTSLLRGRARAVVFGTGMNTEIGKIANLTQDIRSEPSPLQNQLRGTVYAISALAGSLGLAFLLLGWLVGGLTFLEAFVFFIGLFVANVPEGLLPTVTLSLAMGVQRMAKRHALVKSLPSVETLGCTTVICCDKTGTLTQNLMMATEIAVDGEIVEITGIGYSPRGEFTHGGKTLSLDAISRWSTLRRLLDCAFICNNAKIEQGDADDRVIGDPTEGALICLAEKAGFRGVHQRLHLNPFESMRKRMSVVVKHYHQLEPSIYVKGAPVETLQRCDRIHWQGETRPLTELDRMRILKENDGMANRGLRVLAFAYRDGAELAGTPYTTPEIETSLVFLGLAALSDPVRPEVPDAIHACHSAGIRVIMITGDYALTAETIGRQIGLGQNAPLPSFTGADISEMSDQRLATILTAGETIFARVAPEHKLRIVSTLKQLGEIVAVTGDGVNDAPALKKADIGIAMGLRGNDVAKEAARMILTDDNFSSIVAAIEEGRAIFENIRRFMAYIFNSNPQEMYPYIFWMLFPGMPLAMTVMGVLAVDVGTDLIPAMGLGIEPPEEGIMERPPRRRDEKLLSIAFILRSYFVQGSLLALSCYLTYYYAGWALGVWRFGDGLTAMPSGPDSFKLENASTVYLQTLTAYFFPTVTSQLANVLCKRSSRASLFERNFLTPARRSEMLAAVRQWRPPRYTARLTIDERVKEAAEFDLVRAFFAHAAALIVLPFRFVSMFFFRLLARVERRVIAPVTAWLAGFLDRHYVVFNLVSNPLIDVGILFELVLCYLFFYTPLAKIYYFAPVPWHVYLVALNGTVILLAFEEAKKYYRRKGHRWNRSAKETVWQSKKYNPPRHGMKMARSGFEATQTNPPMAPFVKGGGPQDRGFCPANRIFIRVSKFWRSAMAHELKADRFLHGNSRPIALISVIASLLYFFSSSLQSRAADLNQASIADQLVGGEFSYVVQSGDSFTSIGARFGTNIHSLAARNGLAPSSLLKVGQVLKVDNRHIVPDHESNGIVINIPQRMLFYFSNQRLIHAFPVALGRPDWPTPTGKFQVAVKEENPTWEVPNSIQEEMRREGQVVRTCVPPGPDNPLGSHWLGLTIHGYGIHGTIAPASIYHFRTHGCIRLHPDDIATLFREVSTGTPVELVYQDVLMAKIGRSIYLEAHNDVYKKHSAIRGRFQAMLESYDLESAVDRELAEDIIRQREGIAREITKGTGADNLP